MPGLAFGVHDEDPHALFTLDPMDGRTTSVSCVAATGPRKVGSGVW